MGFGRSKWTAAVALSLVTTGLVLSTPRLQRRIASTPRAEDTAPDFGSLEGIRGFVEDHHIRSIEEFIENLPEEFRSNWVFAPASTSVQVGHLPGTEENKTGGMLPRVLMVGRNQGRANATVVLSFTVDEPGRLNEKGEDTNENHFESIEVDIRRGARREAEFHELTFNKGSLLTYTDRPDGTQNTADCTSCHTDQLTHDFEPTEATYFPSRADAADEQSWLSSWRERIEKECKSDICSDWKKSLARRVAPLEFPSRIGASELFQQFLTDTAIRLDSTLRSRDDYLTRVRPALLSALLGCENPKRIVAEDAKKATRADEAVSKVEKESDQFETDASNKSELMTKSLGALGIPQRPNATWNMDHASPEYVLRLRVARNLTHFFRALGDQHASISHLTFGMSLGTITPHVLREANYEILARAFAYDFPALEGILAEQGRGRISESENATLAKACATL